MWLSKTSGSMPTEVYPSKDPKFSRFSSRRSPVHSTKGIVSCTQPLAARAGVRILEQGGNAADAAVATAAALNVTEPASTGIGGDMFCLFYDAKAKKTRALNGSGRSTGSLDLQQLRELLQIPDDEQGDIPSSSPHSITVPGAAAGWVDTVEKFGSGKLSLEQILTPAIELAEEGFPVHHISSVQWNINEERLRKASPNYAELLKRDASAPNGVRAPKPGEIFSNPNLGNTFRLLAKHGKSGFYEGPVAESIAKIVKDLGGCLNLDDLKHHASVGSDEVEPLSLKFSGQGISEPIELWEHPPNGQGLVALLALGVLQELEKTGKIPTFTQDDHNSLPYLHALIEALRIGFTDGTWFVTDPAMHKIPTEQLLAQPYLASRAALFSADRANPRVTHGSPAMSSSDTVYLSVTDAAGNAASFINSVYVNFGSAIIPAGSGFPLQNRGSNFSLTPKEQPNVFAPRKRPYHTIIPAMITNARDGSLNTCYGVMGGFMQPQGHVQVLMNMFVFGMNPQEALDAPRICIESPGQKGQSDAAKDQVYVEAGIADDVVKGLERLGHQVFVVDGFNRAQFGRGQVIRRNVEDGRLVWSAGSDPRGDGHASPL